MDTKEKLNRCLGSIRLRTDFEPEVLLILGSGLGGFADRMEKEISIPYSDIECFPVSGVSGHAGVLHFGYVDGVRVAAMQGRVHYYEGHDMSDVVLPLRVIRMMGAKTLILTNAAGGINKNYRVGDFMLIRDHISSFVPSPLRGANIDSLGTRFPDMTAVYDKKLGDAAKKCAKEKWITLQEGVYLQTPGPQFETPAEIEMYRGFGADAVGMSTACEAVAARHAGYRVCGISMISNAAAGMSGQPLTHEEVKAAADKAAENFAALVEAIIASVNK